MTENTVPSDHSPIARDIADHYVWGGTCDGWHLVRSPALSVIEERMPLGTREVRHRHAHARQFFYVLSGTLTMEVEEATHVLHARVGIEVPPGAAHQARNESGSDVEFIVVSTPPSHGDRITAEAGKADGAL